MFHGEFLVPEYYLSFSCKGKKCRKCCCDGFVVTLNEKEYFSLHNLDVSKELKDKIDAFVGLVQKGNEEEYGRIYPNFYGECPLRLSNGYCGLQMEVGEERIPSVCRYFPRAPRLYPFPYVCLSLACEWVSESFFQSDQEVLGFQKKELSFFFQDDEKKEDETSKEELLSFVRRFNSSRDLFDILLDVRKDFDLSSDKERESYLLSRLKTLYRRSSLFPYLSNIEYEPVGKKELMEMENRVSGSLSVLKKMMVNHILYMQVPCMPNLTRKDSVFAFLYLFDLFVLMVLQNGIKDRTEFVDMVSSCFRTFEHSNVYAEISLLVENTRQKKS